MTFNYIIFSIFVDYLFVYLLKLLFKLFSFLSAIHITGWIAFFGDVLHKAVDGFAIGACKIFIYLKIYKFYRCKNFKFINFSLFLIKKAFSTSISLGLSTCLAIFFHEIPHELGEYGVLIKSGFSHCTILLLNSFSSFWTLVGFFIIASINITNEQVTEYIFAIIGGVFVYIALVIMVSLGLYTENIA
jgi:zinc transporter ZupT